MKKTKPTPKPYKVEMVFNGSTFKKTTDDVAKTIVELKPDVLHTEVYVSVSKGKDTMERKLNLVQGKRLFLSEDFLSVFISNLMFA